MLEMNHFFPQVILECAGLSQTLFTVTGACQGSEIKLDSDAIPFGTVTLGSSSSRKLIMVNSGDIGSSFEWNIDRFQPSFNISPVKGYISPGMEVPFEIEFTPKSVSQDIRCDVRYFHWVLLFPGRMRHTFVKVNINNFLYS